MAVLYNSQFDISLVLGKVNLETLLKPLKLYPFVISNLSKLMFTSQQ